MVTLTVNVNGNLVSPIFTQAQYNMTILEIQAVSQPFLVVRADDQDTYVCFVVKI